MKNLILFTLLTLLLLQSCSNEIDEVISDSKEKTYISSVESEKQLNITILLDLSDRIEPAKYPATPEHYERDISIIDKVVDIFKTEITSVKAKEIRGKIKVIMKPNPKDDEVNSIAKALKIDLSNDNVDKLDVYYNISQIYSENLKKIYAKTIETNSPNHYVGSDTWRFFKNDVNLCVDNSGLYRNVLIIISDGYIFHIDSKDKDKNRTTFLTPEHITTNKLIGNKSEIEKRIKENDYGYISTRNDLQDLEILFLEVNPTPDRKNDEDAIKAYLGKWFDEMGVKSFKIYNSDIPVNTETKIKDFFN